MIDFIHVLSRRARGSLNCRWIADGRRVDVPHVFPPPPHLHGAPDGPPLGHDVREGVCPQGGPEGGLGKGVGGQVAVQHPRHPQGRLCHPVEQHSVHPQRQPVHRQHLAGDGEKRR